MATNPQAPDSSSLSASKAPLATLTQLATSPLQPKSEIVATQTSAKASATKKPDAKKLLTKKPTAKKPIIKKPVQKKVTLKSAPTKTVTAAKPKTIAKPVVKKAIPKIAAKKVAIKKEKPRKIKMKRDSFTMPKDEYAQIDLLKKRLINLGQPAKKSELIRAGIQLLAGMSDSTLKATLSKIPVIKTGRPKK
jgi:hypothetical protein